MKNPEGKLVERYFRKTKAHPEGHVCHHGDCYFFTIRICTCGLHHDLRILNPECQTMHYPLADIEIAEADAVCDDILHKSTKKAKRK